jgi:hypothetical protein
MVIRTVGRPLWFDRHRVDHTGLSKGEMTKKRRHRIGSGTMDAA